ncbi:hypothetical protein BFP77_02630 [Maribacter sp. 4U21]|uniref:DUF418 domain-containing protein n=1 Tax=Maribacter sp. 4U21 TaxID=1889779 RepID=UPI000C146E08|nr:DUF418 domain-containing protein [Maribacter sp. 4U21]PIB30972.1 hypothetical protein BFP77_02630 [Maribacter sp. 4U21]
MSSSKSTRIEIIDSLRSLALAGILICHMTENYIGSMSPQSFNDAVHVGVIDNIIDGLIFFFLRGKFIALFSFLFGLSFFIQMDNGSKKGKPFGGRFLWRLIILLAIGYVHSLFYRGDILTIYAFLGLFLIPFYRIKSKWLLAISAILFLGIARYIIYFFIGTDSIWGGSPEMDNNAAWVVDYYNVLKEGSLWDVFKANGLQGHLDKADYQFSIFGRGYFTFAFFLIGLFVGRQEYFKNYRNNKKLLKNTVIWSSVILVVSLGLVAGAFSQVGPDGGLDSWFAMVGLSAVDIGNMAMTFLWIAIFVILYKKTKPERWLSKLAPYGRMALTNYVLQSIIGTLLLYGWGFGLIGELRQLYTFLIALVFIAFQVWLSKIWLSYYNYGPLEWLWRSLTFFKIFPFKKP